MPHQRYYFLAAFIPALLTTYSSNSTAEIYSWQDENGLRHFSDTAPQQQSNVIQFESNQAADNRYESQATKKDKSNTTRVILYSTQWCGYCRQARQYLTRNNIPFTEYDIELSYSAKRTFEQLGGQGVPLLVIEDAVLNGFTPKSFERLYLSRVKR